MFPVRAFRDRDMSNNCRYFGTRIVTGSHKLLIVKGGATVAEGRQGDGGGSRPDNKKLHCKAKAISRKALRRSGFAAQAMTAEPDPSS